MAKKKPNKIIYNGEIVTFLDLDKTNPGFEFNSKFLHYGRNTFDQHKVLLESKYQGMRIVGILISPRALNEERWPDNPMYPNKCVTVVAKNFYALTTTPGTFQHKMRFIRAVINGKGWPRTMRPGESIESWPDGLKLDIAE